MKDTFLILFLITGIISGEDISTPINTFGLSLLEHLPADENSMISPFSICTAVAMLNAGTAGNTKTQIDEAFGWSGSLDVPELYRTLLSNIEQEAGGEQGAGGEFVLKSSNRMYIDTTFTPLPAYQTTLNEDFHAEVEAVNFSSGDTTETVEKINNWVEEETNGKITDMLNTIENDLRAILINTIYFKGSWVHPFTSSSQEVFYLDEQYAVKTDTMHVEKHLAYHSDDEVELVKLPYQGSRISSRISMVVVKPRTRAGLVPLEEKIQYKFSEVVSWMEAAEYTLVRLSMPKFEFKSGFEDLTDVLKANFGVTDVFNPVKADLTGISSSENLYVSYIKHKSFISVDENGTEAAAATAIGISLASIEIETDTPLPVLMNQPFMFLIYDERNKVVLFVGRMVVPDQSVLSSKYLDKDYTVRSGAGESSSLVLVVVFLAVFGTRLF